MTEADILAMTYTDTCTVFRPVKAALPSGESCFRKGLEGQVIYEDIPCALSSLSGGHSGGKPTKTQTVVKVDTDYMLFVRPEVDIQAGDTVLVTRLGKKIEAEAGLPDRQPSHNNVPLKASKSNA